MDAVVGWIATGAVALSAVAGLFAGADLWAAFSLVVAVVVAVPALATRDRSAMVAWPLTSLTAGATVASVAGFYGEITGHIALASLAFLAVVELDAFTAVDLSRRFVIVFGVLTTMALQAVWIVAQFYTDRWFGSEFLSTQTELQWDMVTVTVVGAVLGGLCEWYFARVEPPRTVDESSNRREAS